MASTLPLHCVSAAPTVQDPSGKSPVVVLLHGYGSHENDLFSFANDLRKSHYIISLRAPIRLGFGGFAWYEINWSESGEKWTDVEAGLNSMKLLEQTLDELDQHFPIDCNRITLMGFSQGAIMSYAYSFRHPEKLEGVIAMSGYIVKELMPAKAVMNRVQNIPFYITHGSEDPVIPISWAKQSVEYLEKLQISHTFRTYPMPHGISPNAYSDLKTWLVENLRIG